MYIYILYTYIIFVYIYKSVIFKMETLESGYVVQRPDSPWPVV